MANSAEKNANWQTLGKIVVALCREWRALSWPSPFRNEITASKVIPRKFVQCSVMAPQNECSELLGIQKSVHVFKRFQEMNSTRLRKPSELKKQEAGKIVGQWHRLDLFLLFCVHLWPMLETAPEGLLVWTGNTVLLLSTLLLLDLITCEKCDINSIVKWLLQDTLRLTELYQLYKYYQDSKCSTDILTRPSLI